MSAPSPPADRSVELRQLELDAANQERIRQTEEDRILEQKLAGLRSDALTFGRGQAESFFGSQGLVPGDYTSGIERELSNILAGVPRDDPNPNSYFSNVGQRIFDTEQEGARNVALRDIDRFAPSGFANRRVEGTLDDPILAAIQAEQRGEADAIIQNMLARGVITNTGFAGASSDLNRQAFGVKAQLDQIGSGAIETGRQSLRDIANTGRQQASTLRLGVPFNPYDINTDIDTKFAEILSGLSSNIRGQVQSNLFDTSGLAAIAGATSGAQNTSFNPAALAGIIEEPEEDKQAVNSGASIF